MKLAADGYTIEADKDGDDTATVIAGSGDDSHTMELDNIRVVGPTLTATAALTFFINLSIIMNVTNTGITVQILHSLFADGVHNFPLDDAQRAEVEAFMKEFS